MPTTVAGAVADLLGLARGESVLDDPAGRYPGWSRRRWPLPAALAGFRELLGRSA